MSTLKHKKSAKKVRWSKNKGKKHQKSQHFDCQVSKCAIFTRGNMILIKDRHIQMPYIFPPSSSDLENMVLMKFVMICCLMCVDTVVIMA